MNVTISKTEPLFSGIDPRYPDYPPVLTGHQIFFIGLEGKTSAQIWAWDIVYNRFTQKSTMLPIDNGMMIVPLSVILGTHGIMCLKLSTDYPVVLSNKFNYELQNIEVVGGSVNLGDPYADMPFSQLTVTQGGTTTTTTTSGTKGRGKK